MEASQRVDRKKHDFLFGLNAEKGLFFTSAVVLPQFLQKVHTSERTAVLFIQFIHTIGKETQRKTHRDRTWALGKCGV